eukprot:TRINITY_DN3042_c0_g1_i1.p1 TRINITY_DN3042_c0_g1~~TRINITY_DN3042_c0_g1_i1.p1  ORF type:complete len:315 (+),score=58.02 TRINITY_DN3042_c0_g1_i1:152-1096(+)
MFPGRTPARMMLGAWVAAMLIGGTHSFTFTSPLQHCARRTCTYSRSSASALAAGGKSVQQRQRWSEQVLMAQAQEQEANAVMEDASSAALELSVADAADEQAGEITPASGPEAATETAEVAEAAAAITDATGVAAAADADAALAEAGGDLKELADMAAMAPLAEPEPERKVRRVKKFFARDFANSTWAVAILWGARRKPQMTKVFLRDDGKVVWLDKGKGSWRLDTKSRSLGFYRDFFLGWKGKRIFSTRLLDNCNEHYLEGEVKGWGPWFPLKWMGQWQAIRLGVDLEKHGPAPWLQREAPEGMEAVEAGFET